MTAIVRSLVTCEKMIVENYQSSVAVAVGAGEGVVGSTGMTTPSAPSTRKSMLAASVNQRLNGESVPVVIGLDYTLPRQGLIILKVSSIS